MREEDIVKDKFGVGTDFWHRREKHLTIYPCSVSELILGLLKTDSLDTFTSVSCLPEVL